MCTVIILLNAVALSVYCSVKYAGVRNKVPGHSGRRWLPEIRLQNNKARPRPRHFGKRAGAVGGTHDLPMEIVEDLVVENAELSCMMLLYYRRN